MSEWNSDAAAAASINLLAQATNNIAQSNINKKTRKWNEQQSELAYNRQIEMWNMANAYNTPSAQMKRMAEAGLNPNLIYGNMNNTPASSTTPSYKPPEASYDLPLVDMTSTIGAFQNVLMNGEKIRQMAIQNSALEQDIRIKTIEEQYQNLQLLKNKLGLYVDYNVDAGLTEIPTDGLKLLKRESQIIRNALMSKDVNLKDLDMILKSTNIDLNKAKLENVDMDTLLKQAKIGLTETQTDLATTNIDAKKVDISKTLREIDLLIENTALTMSKKEGQDLLNDWNTYKNYMILSSGYNIESNSTNTMGAFERNFKSIWDSLSRKYSLNFNRKY